MAARSSAIGVAPSATPRPTYTSAGRYDVGLADEVGNRKFNPPSLRGVGRRDRFLHDGRASSLEEVFRDHAPPPGAVLSPRETADLIAFLKTLCGAGYRTRISACSMATSRPPPCP